MGGIGVYIHLEAPQFLLDGSNLPSFENPCTLPATSFHDAFLELVRVIGRPYHGAITVGPPLGVQRALPLRTVGQTGPRDDRELFPRSSCGARNMEASGKAKGKAEEGVICKCDR